MPFLTKFAKPTCNSTLWTQKKIYKASPFPRQDYSVCEILDDIYIFAGSIEKVPQNDLHIIDSRDFSIEVAKVSGEIPCPRSGHTATNIGRYILVFGGETINSRWDVSLYSLNIGSKIWTRLPMQSNSLVGRRDHSAVAIGSTMYLFGGQVDNYYFNDLVAFDTKSLSTQTPHWDYIVPGYGSPPERACHSAVVYKNEIYIFGGNDVDTTFDDFWCYDPKSNIWSQITTSGSPSKRTGHTACSHNDLMYIFGGKDESGQFLNEVYIFHFIGRTWSVLPGGHLNTMLPNIMRTCTVQEKIHILMGEADSISNHSVVHILDTAKVKEYININSNGIHFPIVVNHNGALDKQTGNDSLPPSPIEYYKELSLSVNDNELISPSPTISGYSSKPGSLIQSSANILQNNHLHSSLELRTLGLMSNVEKPSDLNSKPPTHQPSISSSTAKPKPLNVLQNEPNSYGHLPNTTPKSEGTMIKENIKVLREQMRQFATFIPLNIEKVNPSGSDNSRVTRSQLSKQLTSNTTRKIATSIQTTEDINTIQSTFNCLSSHLKDTHAIGACLDETICLSEFSALVQTPDLLTLQSTGNHNLASSSISSGYTKNVNSTGGELNKHPEVEHSFVMEVAAIDHDNAKDKGNTETILWDDLRKIVSEKTGSSIKQLPISLNLNTFQGKKEDPEKIKLLQALLLLKDQLNKAQANVTQTCEYTTRRIADEERQRLAALQEAAYLKMRASAINNSSLDELRKIEHDRIVELEKRLVKTLHDNQALQSKINLQVQTSAKYYGNQLLVEESLKTTLNRAIDAENNYRIILEKNATLEEALKKAQQTACEANIKASRSEATLYAKETESMMNLERLAFLEECLAQERQARELAISAVVAANERANEAERMWMDAQQEIQALERESIELRKTIEQKSEELARAHFQAREIETLWFTTKQQVESLDCISQVFKISKNHSEKDIEEKLVRANYRIAELKSELNLLYRGKEESNDAIERVEKENQVLAQKAEEMEKKHLDVQSNLNELRLRLTDAQDRFYETKFQFMNSQDLLRLEAMELEEARLKITTLSSIIQEMDRTGNLDSHKIVALVSDKLVDNAKSFQSDFEDNPKLRQQLETLEDHLNQTKSYNKELQEKYKNTLHELHSIVEKQQWLIDSEKAANARAIANEHKITKLRDEFLAMQVKADSLEELLRQSHPKPSTLSGDADLRLRNNQTKMQQLEHQLQEAEMRSTQMEKDTKFAIKYVRDSELMPRKMKARLRNSQK